MAEVININEAQANLAELIAKVQLGEAVVIVEQNKPVAKLVGLAAETSTKKRQLGLAAGSIIFNENPSNPLDKEELQLWDKPSLVNN